MLYMFNIETVTAVTEKFDSDQQAISHAWDLSMEHKGKDVLVFRHVKDRTYHIALVKASYQYALDTYGHRPCSLPRGICKTCGRRIRLTDSGTLYRHGHTGGHRENQSASRCPGSHQTPVG